MDMRFGTWNARSLCRSGIRHVEREEPVQVRVAEDSGQRICEV
jgi:hypothetical protein